MKKYMQIYLLASFVSLKVFGSESASTLPDSLSSASPKQASQLTSRTIDQGVYQFLMNVEETAFVAAQPKVRIGGLLSTISQHFVQFLAPKDFQDLIVNLLSGLGQGNQELASQMSQCIKSEVVGHLNGDSRGIEKILQTPVSYVPVISRKMGNKILIQFNGYKEKLVSFLMNCDVRDEKKGELLRGLFRCYVQQGLFDSIPSIFSIPYFFLTQDFSENLLKKREVRAAFEPWYRYVKMREQDWRDLCIFFLSKIENRFSDKPNGSMLILGNGNFEMADLNGNAVMYTPENTSNLEGENFGKKIEANRFRQISTQKDLIIIILNPKQQAAPVFTVPDILARTITMIYRLPETGLANFSNINLTAQQQVIFQVEGIPTLKVLQNMAFVDYQKFDSF